MSGGPVGALLAWTAANADTVRRSQAESDRSIHLDDAVQAGRPRLSEIYGRFTMASTRLANRSSSGRRIIAKESGGSRCPTPSE